MEKIKIVSVPSTELSLAELKAWTNEEKTNWFENYKKGGNVDYQSYDSIESFIYKMNLGLVMDADRIWFVINEEAKPITISNESLISFKEDKQGVEIPDEDVLDAINEIADEEQKESGAVESEEEDFYFKYDDSEEILIEAIERINDSETLVTQLQCEGGTYYLTIKTDEQYDQVAFCVYDDGMKVIHRNWWCGNVKNDEYVPRDIFEDCFDNCDIKNIVNVSFISPELFKFMKEA